jgi:hypothetical protein
MSIEEIKEQQVVETPVEETPSAEITPVENEIEEETGEEQEVEETQEEKAKRNRRTKAQIEAEKEWETADLSKAYGEDIGDMYKAPPELLEEFKAFAKEKGYTAQQASELLNLQAEMVKKQEALFEKHIVAETEATRKELEAEWGADFDANMKGIKNLIDSRASEEVQNLIITSFGSNKEMLTFLNDVAKDLAEPKYFDGNGQGVSGSFATAQDEWNNEVIKVPALRNALTDRANPLYNQAQNTWNSIMNKHEAIRIKSLQYQKG